MYALGMAKKELRKEEQEPQCRTLLKNSLFRQYAFSRHEFFVLQDVLDLKAHEMSNFRRLKEANEFVPSIFVADSLLVFHQNDSNACTQDFVPGVILGTIYAIS